MSSRTRTLSYGAAINEALHQLMAEDPSVFLIGQGVKSPWYVGNTCNGLLERFGPKRVIDTPVSENAITGAAVGAAIAGMRPVVVHPRMDFMSYAFDAIINEAANWHYMFGGKSCVPVVFWGIVNRGGEQAAQHSQTLHATFSHFPGLKVVMPSTPGDAKGLLIAAVRDPNPVVYVDDRWLYGQKGPVTRKACAVLIGRGIVRKRGRDLTIVSASAMALEALKAGHALSDEGIDAEVIDLRTMKPFDKELLLRSVRKTGRLLVADGGWTSFGAAAELIAAVTEVAFDALKTSPRRVALPDVPAPASAVMEKAYYPDYCTIASAARMMMKGKRS